EPVFDHFCDALLSRRSGEARRGAIFVDPHAKEPYLFHLGEVDVLRRGAGADATALFPNGPVAGDGLDADIVETRLIGLGQERDGSIARCPLEHLLLLRGANAAAPGGVPLARLARELTDSATQWLRSDALAHMVEDHRARIESALPERLDWVARGYDYKTA